MAYPFSIPQTFKVVDATAGPVTTDGGVTSDYVSLKNALKAWVVVQFTQAVGHATSVAIRQASAVAGTSVKAITVAVPIWANEDTAASDTLEAQTAAVSYAVTNDVKKKMVIFEIDPATLDLANGFDCLNFTVSDSSQATNFVSGMFFLWERYQGTTPPAAITD